MMLPAAAPAALHAGGRQWQCGRRAGGSAALHPLLHARGGGKLRLGWRPLPTPARTRIAVAGRLRDTRRDAALPHGGESREAPGAVGPWPRLLPVGGQRPDSEVQGAEELEQEGGREPQGQGGGPAATCGSGRAAPPSGGAARQPPCGSGADSELRRRPLVLAAAAAAGGAAWGAQLPAPGGRAAAAAAAGVVAPQAAAALPAEAAGEQEQAAAWAAAEGQPGAEGAPPASSSSSSAVPFCPSGRYSVRLAILPACRLGVSLYPDFAYAPENGGGTGTAVSSDHPAPAAPAPPAPAPPSPSAPLPLPLPPLAVEFPPSSLLVPPLSSASTTLLGLPLPAPLRIDIVPQRLAGVVRPDTGQVDLTFVASFLFSAGPWYRAPPLLVSTVLTTERSQGQRRAASGRRMDAAGRCRLVGVARVAPVGDGFLDRFLVLPTDVLAELPAQFSFACQAAAVPLDTYSP